VLNCYRMLNEYYDELRLMVSTMDSQVVFDDYLQLMAS